MILGIELGSGRCLGKWCYQWQCGWDQSFWDPRPQWFRYPWPSNIQELGVIQSNAPVLANFLTKCPKSDGKFPQGVCAIIQWSGPQGGGCGGGSSETICTSFWIENTLDTHTRLSRRFMHCQVHLRSCHCYFICALSLLLIPLEIKKSTAGSWD